MKCKTCSTTSLANARKPSSLKKHWRSIISSVKATRLNSSHWLTWSSLTGKVLSNVTKRIWLQFLRCWLQKWAITWSNRARYALRWSNNSNKSLKILRLSLLKANTTLTNRLPNWIMIWKKLSNQIYLSSLRRDLLIRICTWDNCKSYRTMRLANNVRDLSQGKKKLRIRRSCSSQLIAST